MTAIVERPVTVPTLSPEEMEALTRVKREHDAPPAPMRPATVEEAIATPEWFARWLADKQDDAIVGRSGSSSSCPLHTFLTETFKDDGLSRFSVCGGCVVYSQRRRRHQVSCPAWVYGFIGEVDGRGGGHRITAGWAKGWVKRRRGRR